MRQRGAESEPLPVLHHLPFIYRITVFLPLWMNFQVNSWVIFTPNLSSIDFRAEEIVSPTISAPPSKR